MKYRRLLLILLLITTSIQIQQTSAIQFSANEYWFYIQEPQLISFPDMKFTILNSGEDPIMANATVEYIAGTNFTTYLGWNSTIIAPGETVENTYAFDVFESLGANYEIRIHCTIQSPENGTSATTGGIIKSHIIYYSDNQGALMDFKVVDQSNTRRESSVIIRYRPNNTMPWSPIDQFNGTTFRKIMPLGLYQIQAKDLETDIYTEKTFTFTMDIEFKMVLQLVTFTKMIVKMVDDALAIDLTVVNLAGPLTNISIYAELYSSNKIKIQTSNNIHFDKFPSTNIFDITISFLPINLEIGNYTIIGKMDSFGKTIVDKSVGIEIIEEIKPSNDALIITLLIIGITSAAIISYLLIRKNISDDIKCPNCKQNLPEGALYCFECGGKINEPQDTIDNNNSFDT